LKVGQQDTVNTISNSQTNRVFDASKPTGGSGRTPQSVGSPADGVDLGNQTGLLSQALSANSDSRNARVEELKGLVQSGQYHVDVVALSRSIVDAALNGG